MVGILGFISTLITVVAVGIMVLFWVIVFSLVRKRRMKKATATDSAGRTVERTRLAKTGFLAPDTQQSMLDRAGTDKAAPTSLGTTIMRPGWGSRLQALACVPIAWALFFTPYFENEATQVGAGFIYSTPYLAEGLFGLILVMLLVISIYEVRYDRDGVVITRFLTPRKAFNWHELDDIKSDGDKVLFLWLKSGRKLKMQRHLVGIADFLTVAHDRIAQNEGRPGQLVY